MKIADMKVTELINEVGSGTPAPGGGAVADAGRTVFPRGGAAWPADNGL